VPIIDKQTPHLTLDYDVIEQGKQVPRKSQGSVSLSLPLSTMSKNRPMSENTLSSHDNDCLGWEVCNEAGQEGTQQGDDECLDDTCDLENDYQSGNDDCDEDDNFTATLTSIEKDTRSLQAVVSTLHDLQNTLRQDPNHVLTKNDRAFLKEVHNFAQSQRVTSYSPRVPKGRKRQLEQAKRNKCHRMTSKGKKAAKNPHGLYGRETHRKGNMQSKQKKSPLKRRRMSTAHSQTQPSCSTDLDPTGAT
jgi:hypothetical protein